MIPIKPVAGSNKLYGVKLDKVCKTAPRVASNTSPNTDGYVRTYICQGVDLNRNIGKIILICYR